MLDFLNTQMISSLTDGINNILEDTPTYDPTLNFTNYTISLLSSAIKIGLYSPCVLLNSFPTLYLSHGIKNQINSLIK